MTPDIAKLTKDRDFLIYYARVNLREARVRRARDPAFANTLLGWATKARRQAAALTATPAQGDLFTPVNARSQGRVL